MLSTTATAKYSSLTVIGTCSVSGHGKQSLHQPEPTGHGNGDSTVECTSVGLASLSLSAQQNPLCLTHIPSEILYQIIDLVASSPLPPGVHEVMGRDVLSLFSLAFVHPRFYHPCRSAIAKAVHLRDIENAFDTSIPVDPSSALFRLRSDRKLEVSATAVRLVGSRSNQRYYHRQTMVIDTNTHPVSHIRLSGNMYLPGHEQILGPHITRVDLSLAITAELLSAYLCQVFDTCPKLRHLRVQVPCADDYAIVSDHIRQHLRETRSGPVALRTVHFFASHACGNRHETADPCAMTNGLGWPWFTCQRISLRAPTIDDGVIFSVLRDYTVPHVQLSAWRHVRQITAGMTTVASLPSHVKIPFLPDIVSPHLRSLSVLSLQAFCLLTRLSAPNLRDLEINRESSAVFVVRDDLISGWALQMPRLKNLALCNAVLANSALKILMSIPQLKTLELNANLPDRSTFTEPTSQHERVQSGLVSLTASVGVACYLSEQFAFPFLKSLTVTESPGFSRTSNKYALMWSSFPSLTSVGVFCAQCSTLKLNLSIDELPDAGAHLRHLFLPITLLTDLNPILPYLPALDSLHLYSPPSLNASVVPSTANPTAATSFTIRCHPLDQGINIDSLQSLPHLPTLTSLIIGKPNPSYTGTEPSVDPSTLLMSSPTLDRLTATLARFPRLHVLKLDNVTLQPTKRDVLVIPAAAPQIVYKILANVYPCESLRRVTIVVPADQDSGQIRESVDQVRPVWAGWCREQGRSEVRWSVVETGAVVARGKGEGLDLRRAGGKEIAGDMLSSRKNLDREEQFGGLEV